MDILKKVILTSILVLVPFSAHAEWQNAVQNPHMQIAPQDAFAIADAKFHLSNDDVTVAYTIKPWINLYDVRIHFDVLPYAWLGEAVIYLDRSFSELSLEINKNVVNMHKEYKAYFENKDITKELLKNNITPTILNDMSTWVQDNKHNKEKYNLLLKNGYMTYVAGDRYIPRWWIHPYYWFSAAFKKSENVELEYKHRLFWGANSFKLSAIKDNKNSFLDALFISDNEKIRDVILRLDAHDDEYCKITETRIPWLNIAKYVPIKDITIRIDTKISDNQVAILRVGDGNVYIINNGAEIKLHDFYPQEDLWIVILSKY